MTRAGNITAGDISGAATADTLGGNITLGHVEGDVSAKTKAGDIKLNSAAGQIDARTNAGNVAATISEQPKSGCRLTTNAGNIKVRLRRTLKVNVEAKTDIGRISAPFPGRKRPRKKQFVKLGDALEAKLNGGGPGLVATTNVGNITFAYIAE